MCAVQGRNYVIDEGVEVIVTPGHSGPDIGLIVRNTTSGTVLVAGNSAMVLIYACFTCRVHLYRLHCSDVCLPLV